MWTLDSGTHIKPDRNIITIQKCIVTRFYLRVRIKKLSQGTPHYPVKGKNDYPISNRE